MIESEEVSLQTSVAQSGPDRPLTEKEQMFALCVASGMPLTAAGRKAGYSSNTIDKGAWLIARRPNVAKKIAELRQRHVDGDSMPIRTPKSYVLQKAIQMLDRCLQAVPVFDKEGNQTGEWQFNDRGAVRSLELIADVCGYRTRNVNVKVETADMEGMTRHDLVGQIIKMILRAGIQQEVLEGLTVAVNTPQANGEDVEEAEIVG